MVDEAEQIEHELEDQELIKLLKLRQEIRSSLQKNLSSVRVEQKIWTALDTFTQEEFWDLAENSEEDLPAVLKEILELGKIVSQEVEENLKPSEELVRIIPSRKKKMPRRSAEVKIVSQADERFKSVKYLLTGIMTDLYRSSADGVFGNPKKDEKWKLYLKFEPFIRLARLTDMTPEEWMDCAEARKCMAEWLTEFFDFTPIEARSFYAHVTESFRDRPTSMWQDYRKNLVEQPEPAGESVPAKIDLD